jgi:hypothetical protein
MLKGRSPSELEALQAEVDHLVRCYAPGEDANSLEWLADTLFNGAPPVGPSGAHVREWAALLRRRAIRLRNPPAR